MTPKTEIDGRIAVLEKLIQQQHPEVVSLFVNLGASWLKPVLWPNGFKPTPSCPLSTKRTIDKHPLRLLLTLRRHRKLTDRGPLLTNTTDMPKRPLSLERCFFHTDPCASWYWRLGHPRVDQTVYAFGSNSAVGHARNDQRD